MKKYISIDIGGTAIKYGLIGENAEIILKESIKTEAEKGGLVWLIQKKDLFFILHH